MCETTSLTVGMLEGLSAPTDSNLHWVCPGTDLSLRRLFFGKTKVMAVALGLTEESEPYPNTSLLASHLHGSVGLLFSPRPLPVILEFFERFQPSDFARAGTVAPRSFTIPRGTVHSCAGEIPQEDDVPLAHSIEPTLRKLGVPTKLVKGRVELESEFPVCKEGETLGSGQTSLLKIFGVAMAAFRVQIVAFYDKATESVEEVAGVDMHRDGGGGGMQLDDDGFDGFGDE